MSRKRAAPDAAEVGRHLDAVVAEMRRIGAWDVERPPPEAFEEMGAFGMRTMAFEQWLRWVFVPRARALVEAGGPWPAGSEVGVAAMRNLDGVPEAADLVQRLADFDALFGGSGKKRG